MSAETYKYTKRIHQSVMIYIIGCCFFLLFAIASIVFGYYLIRYYGEHELPLSWLLFSIAGVILLWEMVKAFRIKATIPTEYQLAKEEEYPELFSLIHEVTNTLHLSPIHEVYISPDAAAAVFIQPCWSNLFGEPKRNLVIGMGFLTQMDDDELRTVLYHEFGHYVQKEMKNTVSVYTIAQFSRSFLAIKEPEQQGTIAIQIKSQVLLFTYFAMWVCNSIENAYKYLAKQMEYDADDVAIQYMGHAMLQRTLLHAACIYYNYNVLQWGKKILDARSIRVDNPYLALYFIGRYSFPKKQLLPIEIIKRVERLGEISSSPSLSSTSKVRTGLLKTTTMPSVINTCGAQQFAEWMREGIAIYNHQQSLAKAVVIETHLAPKKHKLPYAEGKYQLLIDGKLIGMGNFIKGFTIRRRISPGKHILTVYMPIGIVMQPFEFNTLENKKYHIELDYAFHFRNSTYEILVENFKET